MVAECFGEKAHRSHWKSEINEFLPRNKLAIDSHSSTDWDSRDKERVDWKEQKEGKKREESVQSWFMICSNML